MPFPDGFVWGAAAAAYQIEGATAADGRSPSVWDAFCSRSGTIAHGDDGSIACDHYHRFAEDVAVMSEMGLDAYRFSIAWPRIIPDGDGKPNPKGLAFYDRLVDTLLEFGIEPWVTLFHWDLPLVLEERGGWSHPDSPKWFERYTRCVVELLSDRVHHWMTFNEPQVFIAAGHGEGWHAPGRKLPIAEQVRIAHHVLLAHGRSVREIRAASRTPAHVGWASQCVAKCPVSAAEVDVAAARSEFFATGESMWSFAWFADAIHRGEYPEDRPQEFDAGLPSDVDTDLRLISQPIDFCGLNIYGGDRVRVENGTPRSVAPPPGAPRTSFDWLVVPEALRWAPRFAWERYRVPIAITENGMASHDWVTLDGEVRDPLRIDFTKRYLIALEKAIDDGVEIESYFHWSLLDNFEWAEGYRQRFGLIHVDFETLRRTPKDSARWYAEVIRTNGASLHVSGKEAATTWGA